MKPRDFRDTNCSTVNKSHITKFRDTGIVTFNWMSSTAAETVPTVIKGKLYLLTEEGEEAGSG